MAKWKPGQSGNPGGRPKGEGDIRELARAHTPKAIGTLVKVMNDENAAPSARVAASEAILNRGWGRPHQTFTANFQNAVEIPLIDVAALLAKVRGPDSWPQITQETDKLPEQLAPPTLSSYRSSFPTPGADYLPAPGQWRAWNGR